MPVATLDNVTLSPVVYTAQLANVTLSDPPARDIVNIDGDNDIYPGQNSVVISVTNLDPAPATQSVTLNGQALSVTSWSSSSITVDVPFAIQLLWDQSYTLTVTDDTGPVVLGDPVILSIPPGWEMVTFDGSIPNTVNTESFYEHASTDAGVGNFTMVANDVIAFQSATGLVVDKQSFPIVQPPSTVSGAYQIWDDSTSNWTSQSTYEWVDVDGGLVVVVPTASLSLTGFTPTVVAEANVWVDVPAGAMTLTGYAPVIEVTADRNISPPAADLSLTTFAPTVTGISVNVEIPAGTMALTGYAPVISVNVGPDVLFSVNGTIDATPVATRGKIDTRGVNVSGRID